MPEHASKSGTEKQQREPTSQEQQFAPETGSPLQTQIFQLQRLVGNKATQRYLQTGSTRIQRDLDDEAVQAAINHYHAIIDSGAIQGDLVRRAIRLISYEDGHEGWEHAGRGRGYPNATGVQLIAEWQVQNRRTETGILTPEEIRDLVVHGLETEDSMDAYEERLDESVEPGWATMPRDQRVALLVDAANERLAAIGVPPMGIGAQTENEASRNVATFYDNRWEVDLNLSRFDPSTGLSYVNQTGSLSYAYLAGMLYHEARHAEQSYMAIRYLVRIYDRRLREVAALALRGGSRFAYADSDIDDWRTQIAGEVPEVVEHARANTTPFNWTVGRYWYQHLYSAGAARDAIVAARDEAGRELAEANESGEGIPEAAAAWGEAFQAYHDQPHESDASRVGDAMTGRMRD